MNVEQLSNLINQYKALIKSLDKIIDYFESSILLINQGACVFDGVNFDNGVVKKKYDELNIIRTNMNNRMLELVSLYSVKKDEGEI